MPHPRSLALFDFDGTLTKKDSFRLLLKVGFTKEPWRLLGACLTSPILLLLILFFGKNKQIIKSYFLWNLTIGKSRRQQVRFLSQVLKPYQDDLLFLDGLNKLKELHSQGISPIVISASGPIWIRSLLKGKFQDFSLIIGSSLGFWAGGVVLVSANCYQNEKIKRLQRHFNSKNINWYSAWSDHIADIPLLKIAKEKHIVSPKKKHLLIFKKEFSNEFFLHNWK